MVVLSDMRLVIHRGRMSDAPSKAGLSSAASVLGGAHGMDGGSNSGSAAFGISAPAGIPAADPVWLQSERLVSSLVDLLNPIGNAVR